MGIRSYYNGFLDGADELYHALENPDDRVGFSQCLKRLLHGRAYNVVPNNEKHYPEICRLLVANFGHTKTGITLRLEEPSETVDSYYYRVRTCMEELKLVENQKYPIIVRELIDDTIENEALAHFEAGLLPAVQSSIAFGKFNSLLEASNAARARETF